jgi:mono/diheme cytochrome c family protein
MRRALTVLVAGVVLLGLWVTSPATLDALPAYTPDAENGERVFIAGGCSSCHSTPVDGKRARGDGKLILGGGLALETDFGVFHVPNISPDDESGIGAWSELDFVNAMQRGTSPDGRHYYPAFPYTSYARMTLEDVRDLKAYLATLQPSTKPSLSHELGFPWSLRRGIGIWKRLYLSEDPVIVIDDSDPALTRGRYLVEAVGHCGECHTPRDGFGGLDTGRWLSGAPNPDGAGRIPNITPGADTIGDWSVADLAYYFQSGFTPDFDTVGGSMVAVQENLAALSEADRNAIASYLKAVPAR